MCSIVDWYMKIMVFTCWRILAIHFLAFALLNVDGCIFFSYFPFACHQLKGQVFQGMGNFWTMVFNEGAGFSCSWGLHQCNSLCWKYRYIIHTDIHIRIVDIHQLSIVCELILEFSCSWLVRGMKLIYKFLLFSMKHFSKMSISVRSCFTCFIWFEFALEGYIQMQSWISHRSHLHQGIPIS